MGKNDGVLILDPRRVGEVSVKTAMNVWKRRGGKKGFKIKEISELAETCRSCGACVQACPNNLPIDVAVKAAREKNYEPLVSLYNLCVGCGRCESACPVDLPIISMITKANEKATILEKYPIRVGRGAIQDVEIR